MPHDDRAVHLTTATGDKFLNLDRIGEAALRLASSADTMNAGFQHTTAAMAKAQVLANGPTVSRRFMWDKSAATVGLYKLNSVALQAWFQPLSLCSEKPVSSLCFSNATCAATRRCR
jgi:hypothetical protein